MGYMFRITIQSSSGPQEVDPDIQTFTALWDPRWGSHKDYNSETQQYFIVFLNIL